MRHEFNPRRKRQARFSNVILATGAVPRQIVGRHEIDRAWSSDLQLHDLTASELERLAVRVSNHRMNDIKQAQAVSP